MRFKLGEICKVSVKPGEWIECEILAPDNYCQHPQGDYVIVIPGHVSSHKSGVWSVQEFRLRKKHPPQQDSQASDESFHDLIHRLNGEKVEA